MSDIKESNEKNFERIKSFLFLVGVFCFEFFLKNKITSNIYLSSIFTILLFSGILFFLKQTVGASWKKSFIFLLSLSAATVGFCFRFWAPVIQSSLMKAFNLTPLDYTKITSFFIMGYALFQPIAGYIVSQSGFYGFSFLVIGAGISTLLISFQHVFANILMIEFAMGICFSFSVVGMIMACKEITKKHFTILSTIGIFTALKLPDIFKKIINKYSESEQIGWKDYHFIFGLIFIIIGILTLFISSMSINGHVILDKEKEEKNKQNNTNLLSDIKFYFSDIILICLSIFSAFIVFIPHVLQDGWCAKIIIEFHKTYDSQILTDILNNCIAYAVIFIPMVSDVIGKNNIFTFASLLNILSIFGVMFYYKNIYILIICMIIFGFVYASHIIIPVYIGENYDNRATVFGGIINMLTMFIGSSIPKLLAGKLISVSSGVKKAYTTKDILFSIKLIAISAPIALLASIVFLANAKKND